MIIKEDLRVGDKVTLHSGETIKIYSLDGNNFSYEKGICLCHSGYDSISHFYFKEGDEIEIAVTGIYPIRWHKRKYVAYDNTNAKYICLQKSIDFGYLPQDHVRPIRVNYTECLEHELLKLSKIEEQMKKEADKFYEIIIAINKNMIKLLKRQYNNLTKKETTT